MPTDYLYGRHLNINKELELYPHDLIMEPTPTSQVDEGDLSQTGKKGVSEGKSSRPQFQNMVEALVKCYS